MKKDFIDYSEIGYALLLSTILGFGLGVIRFLFSSDFSMGITMIFIIILATITISITVSRGLKEKEIHENKLKVKKQEEEEREITENKELELYLDLIKDIKNKIPKYKNVLSLCNDYEKLLSEMEPRIIKIDKIEKKNYIKEFVKVLNFINRKNKHIQKAYSEFTKTKEIIEYNGTHYEVDKTPYIELEELPEKVANLEKDLLLYQEIIFHAISMITALTNNKMIVFYQIYENFDRLGMFENNWQSKVSDDLKKINKKLDQIDKNISQGFEHLTYSIDSSFSELEKSITKELEKINSNISFNNLLTAVQTYKMYQIRKDTKRIIRN